MQKETDLFTDKKTDCYIIHIVMRPISRLTSISCIGEKKDEKVC